MNVQRTPESEQGVRWGLVAAVTVVGLIVTGAPYALARFVDETFGDWQALLSATLTSVGTVLLLVAAVWLLERNFAARITSAVQETTKATVAEETSELRANQIDLSLRLDELQDRLDTRVREDRRAEDALFDGLAAGVSRETVSAVLQHADDMGALWLHGLVIPVGDGAEGLPRFEIRYGKLEAPWNSEDLFNLDGEGSELTIAHVVSNGPGGTAKVTWGPNEAADAVLAELRHDMVRRGQAELAEKVDATLFENLEIALRSAVAGRRRDADAWIVGSLHEWLSDGWVVTSAGLEARDHDGLSSIDFPRHMSGRPGATSNHEARTWKVPSAPDGVDERWWRFVVGRARVVHRMGSGI